MHEQQTPFVSQSLLLRLIIHKFSFLPDLFVDLGITYLIVFCKIKKIKNQTQSISDGSVWTILHAFFINMRFMFFTDAS